MYTAEMVSKWLIFNTFRFAFLFVPLFERVPWKVGETLWNLATSLAFNVNFSISLLIGEMWITFDQSLKSYELWCSLRTLT